MTLSDFSIGQRVALLRQARTFPSWANDRETWGIVKKIGKRYLHVAIEGFDGWIVQFDSRSDFRQKTEYSIDYLLFTDHQSVLDFWTNLWVISNVRKMFSYTTPQLTKEQILSLASALGIDPAGWVQEAPVYSAKEPRA